MVSTYWSPVYSDAETGDQRTNKRMNVQSHINYAGHIISFSMKKQLKILK